MPRPGTRPAQEGHLLRTRTALLGLFAVAAAITAGAGAVVVVRAGEALPGTTVAGVDVGGLGPDDVRERLAGTVTERTTGTLELVHEELRFEVDRAALDARTDLEQTIDDALDAGRDSVVATVVNPVLGPLLGRERSVQLAVQIDETALRSRIDAVGDELDTEPFIGGFAVEGSTVTPQPPAEGRTLDRAAATRALEQALAHGRTEPLPLPVTEQDPGTTAAQVEEVVAQARVALSAPYRLTSAEATIEVTPVELGPLLRTEPVEDPTARDLRLGVDHDALTTLIGAKAAAVSRPATNAGFVPAARPPTVDTQGDLTWSPQPASLTVTPSAPGLSVDAGAALKSLLGLLGTDQREVPLSVAAAEAELTTQEAQSAGITSLLGTFTTYYTAGQPRARNIARIAELVDGAYVTPGDRFSLNGHVGPRTRAKGFEADGAIIDGELVDVVGGGVSQFATTLFNASFFAGLPIEQHQPHSFYISRYPAGRESTVNFGSIDVRVRNDTRAGMVIKTSTTRSSVTVSIYGDNGGRVVTSTSGPREPRDGGGFRISVTRTVTGGDGKGGTRVFRTTYNPPPD